MSKLKKFVCIYLCVTAFFGDLRDANAAISSLPYRSMTGSEMSVSTAALASGLAVAIPVGTAIAAGVSSATVGAVIPLGAGAAATASLAGMPLAAAAITGLAVAVGLVLAYQAIRDAVNGPNGSQYSELKTAAGDTQTPPIGLGEGGDWSGFYSGASSVGKTIKMPNGKYGTVTSESGWFQGWGNQYGNDANGNIAWYQPPGTTQYGPAITKTLYFSTPPSLTPPPDYNKLTPKTDAQIQAGISPGGQVSPGVASDLSTGIRNGDIIPTIQPLNPDGTVNESAPPVTPADIDKARTDAINRATAEAARSAATAAQSAATAASGAVTAAEFAVQKARDISTANPGDAAAELKLKEYERELERVRTEAAVRETEYQRALTEATRAEAKANEYNPAGYELGAFENVGDFGARIMQFINDIKATPLFSVPGSLLNGIPASNVSVITFNANRFGTHSYDFSSWGSILTVLKTLVLIIFSAVAVKIVSLKGGTS